MSSITEHSHQSKSKGKTIDAALLFLLGVTIFFPSSVDGDFERLTLERFVFSIVVLFFLGVRYFKITRSSLLGFTGVACLYIFFTVISEYSQFAFGHIISLAPILMLAMLRVKEIPSVGPVLYLYYLTALFVFSLAYVGFVIPAASDCIISFYSGGYEGLSERFQAMFRPVSIFISHSYAAFFYFIFVFTSVNLMSCGFSKVLNSLIIIVSLISMLLLMSGSSFFFFIYSCLFLICTVFFAKTKSYWAVFIKVFLIFYFFAAIFYFGINYIPSVIERILGDSGNGLFSRYGSGVLAPNLDYLSDNPLRGIGFGYSESLYYTDSDYVVTALRLGVLGAVIYFSYIFLFLYESMKGLVGKFNFLIFFVAVCAFMISMPVSTFYQTTPVFILLVLLFQAISKTASLARPAKQ